MPWAIFNRPSIQLGALKAYLETDKTITADTFHPYLKVAKDIGIESYRSISKSIWAGEALYSPLVFPTQRAGAEKFFQQTVSNYQKPRLDYQKLSERIELTMEHWFNSIDFSSYNLVGLSICFSQMFPSLFAAKKIKKAHPDVPIVFGGSTFGGKVGSSLLTQFPEIDYVIEGEGETSLMDLCHYLAKKKAKLPQQILTRGSHYCQTDQTNLKDINLLPLPDYSDYFKELELHFPGQPFLPVLPVEFSRGCWWNKCSFCNLNNQWKGYRNKSGTRIYNELTHLSDMHRSLDFAFTDNALPPKQTDILFHKLSENPRDLSIFAEIRAISHPNKILAYRRGGLSRVQVGIESFSNSLLKKLAKGTDVINNVATMKYCSQYGILLEGNLITEFPGSTQQEVEETLKCLDFVLPFNPLSPAAFFLGMGSPIEQNPKKFGIKSTTHHYHYRNLFPKKYLTQLDLPIKTYRGDRVIQRQQWKPVVTKMKEWKSFHKNRNNQEYPALSYRDGGTFLIIRQELLHGDALLHRLSGRSRDLYLYCEKIRTLENIQDHFPSIPQ